MAQPWGFDSQPFQLTARSTVRRRYSGIVGKSEFALFPRWVNSGWEIQSIQPLVYPSKNRKRAGIKFRTGFAIPRTATITGTVRDSVGGTANYSVTVTAH